jgi:hypothetical protein
VQHLERHLAAHEEIVGPINATKAPTPDQAQDLVFAEENLAYDKRTGAHVDHIPLYERFAYQRCQESTQPIPAYLADVIA